jgi:hypothetical protein
MKPETSPDTLAIPPALLAEIEAAAEQEHRPALDVLQDAVHRYIDAMPARHDHLDTEPASPELTPSQAVARILELRKGNDLPDGVTIRDLMTHGRA